MGADGLIVMHKQLAESRKAMEDALRRLAKMTIRARLFGGEAVVLTLQPMEKEKAPDAAVLGSVGWLREVGILEARVRMFCDDLDSLNRRESLDCDLDVIARNVTDAQDDLSSLAEE